MPTEPCLLCLEESTTNNEVIRLDFAAETQIPCSCRIFIHIDCWMTYYLSKGGFECPICHSKIVETPLQNVVVNGRFNIENSTGQSVIVSVGRPIDNSIYLSLDNNNQITRYQLTAILGCTIFIAVVFILLIIRPK